MLRWQKSIAVAGLSLASLSLGVANTLDHVINEGNLRAKDNAHSQHKIDKIADITEKGRDTLYIENTERKLTILRVGRISLL